MPTTRTFSSLDMCAWSRAMSVASEEKGGKEGKRQPVDQARATGQLGERVRKMLGNVLTIISCRFLTSRGRFQEANITLCSGKRVPIALRKGWTEKKRSINVGAGDRRPVPWRWGLTDGQRTSIPHSATRSRLFITIMRSETSEEWPFSEGPRGLPDEPVPDAIKASASRRRSCRHFCITPANIN